MTVLQEHDIARDLLSKDNTLRNNAMKLMYKAFYGKIESFVKKNQGNRTDAKDVFQEGMMILYQNLMNDKFRGDSSLFTYMYSICRNIWYQKLKQQPMAVSDDILETESYFQETKELSVNTRTLNAIMKTLKDDCKKVLTGFYYYSQSMEELSKEFGLGSTQAAKNKKSRCLKYLSKIIEDKGLTIESFTK